MKIGAIDTFTLRIPTSEPIALDFPEHRLVVARVHTDGGLNGLGYALVFGGGGSEAMEAYCAASRRPAGGRGPADGGQLWEKMFRADRGIRRVGIAGYARRRARHRAVGHRRQGRRPAALQAVGRGHRPRRGLRQRRLGQVHRRGPHRRGADVRRRRLPLLQDEDPPPRPAGEPRARRGGEEGARRRRAHDGRRQPEARRARQPPPGAAARGPRPRLVRGAGARRRPRGLRGSGARDPHSRSPPARTTTRASSSAS